MFEIIFSKNFSIIFQKLVMFVVIKIQALEVQKTKQKTAFLLGENKCNFLATRA